MALLRFAGLSIALISTFIASAVSAEPEPSGVEIEEWPVPWQKTRPRDPYADSASSVWFVGQTGDYLGHLTPATGTFERVDLEKGTGPHNLVVSEDGIVWYAGNRAAHIGRYDPASGKIRKIPMPHDAAKDPHTLLFNADESVLWFTLQGSNMIGRLIIETEEVTLLQVPTARTRPYGIALAPDGTIWAALFAKPMLLSIDEKTMQMREVRLPRDETRPRRLEVTSDGQVWYADYRGGKLGAYDPGSGKIREWTFPSGKEARPYGMEIDAQDRLWMVETGPQPNKLVGFDTKSGRFFSQTAIPSGGRVVRHMHYLKETGTVWFGTDANTIGRAQVE